MPRKSKKPWYRKGRGWYVQHNGRQILLSRSKAEAHRKFKEMDFTEKPSSIEFVEDIFVKFVEWCGENRSRRTALLYHDIFVSFTKRYPNLKLAELGKQKVQDWIDEKKTWNSTTKNMAIRALNRAFNWAVNNLDLPKNPIKGVEKPQSKSRASVITDEEFAAMLDAVPEGNPFREMLILSFDLGGRPSEIKNIESRHLDLEHQRIVFPKEEAKGKRRPRVLYITTQRAMDILQRRAEEHPEGTILRNSLGNPWTSQSVKCRFARLEEKLGRRFRQYDFRHSWITRKLVAGVDSHVVATLAGHTDTSMIDRVYSHVADDHQFMLDAAKKGVTE